MADFCDFAFRPVPGGSSRSDDGFPEASSGGSWPGAVIQLGAANGRTWQESRRSGKKLDSGS